MSAVPEWPRWGSAADTVCEHATEAEAREHEANTTTVHRWQTGPWVTDAGRIWGGDSQLTEAWGRAFAAETQRAALSRRLSVLRAGLGLIRKTADPRTSWALGELLRADDEAARPLQEVVRDLLAVACSPGSPATHCDRSACTDHGCQEAT